MIEKSFGLLFYLKKSSGNVKGPLPIYLRITVDGAFKEISTKRFCEPERWNKYAQRCKGTNEESRSINTLLETFERQVHEARRKLIEADKTITAESIRDTMSGQGEEKPKMVLEIFQQHNDQLKALVGKQYAPATLKRYTTSLGHTKAFIKWKYKKADIEIKALNYEFLQDYEFWFKSVRNCNHNTAIKYLTNFRKIINRCLKNGWLTRDPFFGFKMCKKEVVRVVLTEDELQAMRNKQFATERLSQVRDIFLFCCFTGLAYADVKKLKRSEIKKGIDGEQWIFTSRQKTESATRLPLLPISQEILAKYADHPQCVNKDTVLPVASNQKMNEYLKEVATLCGIDKTLTFHIARHTFATTVTLTNGVPIETVSKMLGHKNLRATQLYAKVLDRKVSEDMRVLNEKLKVAFQ